MLWVLVLRANGRVVSSRYKGSRDDLCGRRQGLSRHSEATVRVSSDGHFLVAVPFSVWASWATWLNNRLCASDLYVNRGCRFIFCFQIGGSRVHFDVVSFVVWLSRGKAMVEFVPLVVSPRYCCWWVCYLPAKVAVPSVVPWISFVDQQ